MKVIGQVVKIKGNFAYVKSARPASCEHCANAEICNNKSVEICAYNDICAELGDFVSVETNEDKNAPLLLSYLFLTPLAILFLSYGAYTVFPWAALIAFPLFAVYYLILRHIDKKHPVRARVVAPAQEPISCDELTKR